ncbi:hypothetical protein PAMA_015829 [Pampus argenteus]
MREGERVKGTQKGRQKEEAEDESKRKGTEDGYVPILLLVILILTKLYDFHIGSVTESALWRSTDYGSTYERMNDKVGSKTVLSYLYVCPTNKRKGDDKVFTSKFHRKTTEPSQQRCRSHTHEMKLKIQWRYLPSKSLGRVPEGFSADTCLPLTISLLPSLISILISLQPFTPILLHICLTFLYFSQIMVLTDPEFESSVLISSDEGASYQKYRLTFYILSLLFHHTEEDWALAYSHDQKYSNRPTVFSLTVGPADTVAKANPGYDTPT